MENTQKGLNIKINDWYLILVLLVALFLNLSILIELKGFKREVSSFSSPQYSPVIRSSSDKSQDILKEINDLKINDLDQEFQEIDKDLNSL